MAERCVKCGLKSRGFTSPLGEPLCEKHHTEVNAMIIGGMSGGVGGAVAGPGILRWVRGALRPKRKETD